jgi:hypothetical protein
MTDSRARMVCRLLLALSWLVLPRVADAEPRLYIGSLIVDAFNNASQALTPSSIYFTSLAYGIPLGARCNHTLPYHAKEIIQIEQGTAPGGEVISLTIPQYGGQPAVVDTNSDTYPDVPIGCGDDTLAQGNPLVGSGALMSTGDSWSWRTSMDPRAFTITQGALRGTVSGASFEGYDFFSVNYGDLANAPGAFAKSGGDGSFSIVRSDPAMRVVQVAGRHRFGGVMRLLGNYRSVSGYAVAPPILGSYTWLFQYLGDDGQALDTSGRVTAGKTAMAQNFIYTLTSGYPQTSTVTAEVFKWTTGLVLVTAFEGFPTVLQRQGHDDRTALGGGEIQLVSPMLTHWSTSESTAAIGRLTVTFAVPEPESWVMLCVGGTALTLLAARRRRRS